MAPRSHLQDTPSSSRQAHGLFDYKLVCNRSFTLTTGAGRQSRLRQSLKNGVPQRSVLASLLFNIYTYNLTVTASRKFAYSDDLAILHCTNNWQALGGVLFRSWQPYFPIFTNGSSSLMKQRRCRQLSILTIRKHT